MQKSSLRSKENNPQIWAKQKWRTRLREVKDIKIELLQFLLVCLRCEAWPWLNQTQNEWSHFAEPETKFNQFHHYLKPNFSIKINAWKRNLDLSQITTRKKFNIFSKLNQYFIWLKCFLQTVITEGFLLWLFGNKLFFIMERQIIILSTSDWFFRFIYLPESQSFRDRKKESMSASICWLTNLGGHSSQARPNAGEGSSCRSPMSVSGSLTRAPSFAAQPRPSQGCNELKEARCIESSADFYFFLPRLAFACCCFSESFKNWKSRSGRWGGRVLKVYQLLLGFHLQWQVVFSNPLTIYSKAYLHLDVRTSLDSNMVWAHELF